MVWAVGRTIGAVGWLIMLSTCQPIDKGRVDISDIFESQSHSHIRFKCCCTKSQEECVLKDLSLPPESHCFSDKDGCMCRVGRGWHSFQNEQKLKGKRCIVPKSIGDDFRTKVKAWSCLITGSGCKSCVATEARISSSDCASCNVGYQLVGTTCQAWGCTTSTGNGCKACVATESRTSASDCAACNDGYQLVGTTCQDFLYILVDFASHRVQQCDPDEGHCSTIVGTGSKGSSATELHHPASVTLDGAGDYIISDTRNHRVQRCLASEPGSPCSTVAGTGSKGSSATELDHPAVVAINRVGDYIISDPGNRRVQQCPASSPGSPCSTIISRNESGDSEMFVPAGIAIDRSGDYVIVEPYNHCVIKCPASSPGSRCSTVAGTGLNGSSATELHHPAYVAIDRAGDYIISDNGNHRVQRCLASSPGSPCSTIAGTGSNGSSATELNNPSFVFVDGNGDYIISDYGNRRVQHCPALSPGSPCSTITEGSTAGLFRPVGVAIRSPKPK